MLAVTVPGDPGGTLIFTRMLSQGNSCEFGHYDYAHSFVRSLRIYSRAVHKPMMTQLLYVLVGTVLSDAGMLLPVKMSLGLQAIGALGTAIAFVVIMYWFRQECYSVKTE